MGYKDYHTFTFLQDEYFVSWVRHPTEESDRFWEEWLKEHPEKELEVVNAKKIIRSLDFHQKTLNQEETTELLADIIHDVSGNTIQSDKSKERYRIWDKKGLYGIAATLLILILASYYFVGQESPPENTTLHKIDVEYITRKTPIGVKNRIKLTDGTVVYLNSSSELIFQKYFEADKRELYLEGEAYFEVSEDEDRPFIVNINGIKIVALGTSFNIKTNLELDTEISLLTGKVQVEHKGTGKSGLLFPNEKFTWKQQGSILDKERFEPDDVIAWTNNTIVFKGADFNEIISVLTLWYGVEFEILRRPKEISNYSGRFEGKSLDQVLEILSFSSGFNFQIEGKKVIIK